MIVSHSQCCIQNLKSPDFNATEISLFALFKKYITSLLSQYKENNAMGTHKIWLFP